MPLRQRPSVARRTDSMWRTNRRSPPSSSMLHSKVSTPVTMIILSAWALVFMMCKNDRSGAFTKFSTTFGMGRPATEFQSFHVMEAPHNTSSLEVAALASPASPTGCLAMIIKNEGPIMPRLFESVQGFVSEYCIVDTGSTDDTIEVVKSMDMPGVVVEEPFVDFATTRNFMLDTCRRLMTSCEYMVLLDADMVLRVSDEWDWSKVDGKDVYNLIQISSVEYENVRILRREALDVRVVGATHEYYDVPANYSHGLLPKRLVYIDDVGDGKAKGDKFERDERLLRQDLAKDPENARTLFYLGNTLRTLARYEEAIECYQRRISMGGWHGDRDYSVYMLSTCYLALGDTKQARHYGELAGLSGFVPRAEPLYDLVFHFHKEEEYALAWYYLSLAGRIPQPGVSDALFIQNSIYDYWLDYERAVLSFHVFPSEPMVGMRATASFLENPSAPESLKWHVVQHILPQYSPALLGQDHVVGHAKAPLDAFGRRKQVLAQFPHEYQKEVTNIRSAVDEDFTRFPNQVHCVAQWHPLVIGQIDEANRTCMALHQYETPQSFAFLKGPTNTIAVADGGDMAWFLTPWWSRMSEGKPMFSLIGLVAETGLRTYTHPFHLVDGQSETNDTLVEEMGMDTLSVLTLDFAEDELLVGFSRRSTLERMDGTGKGPRYDLIMRRVPLCSVHALLITESY